jgi:hypothetical protein
MFNQIKIAVVGTGTSGVGASASCRSSTTPTITSAQPLLESSTSQLTVSGWLPHFDLIEDPRHSKVLSLLGLRVRGNIQPGTSVRDSLQ